MSDYYLVEFTGRMSVRVYGAKSKDEAISMAEVRIQDADGNDGIGLDMNELDGVEKMEDD